MIYMAQHDITGMSFDEVTHLTSGTCTRNLIVESSNGFSDTTEFSLFADTEEDLRIHSLTKGHLVHEFDLRQVRALHSVIGVVLRNQADYAATLPEGENLDKLERRMAELDDLLQVFEEAERLMEDAELRGVSSNEQLVATPEAM